MWSLALTLAAAVALVHGHGRVLNPPGRGSVWRAGFNARANYDDDGLNCGGFWSQYGVNGGKCGVCGDAYNSAEPRAHEAGGIYDSGIIVGTFEAGSVIPITVELTAHHRGYWEFNICPTRERNDQECFDANPVPLEDGTFQYFPPHSGQFRVNYRLPSNISCQNCVLQWKYTAGNNWGVCTDGTGALGCGDQETFWACSDITIEGGNNAANSVSVDSLGQQPVNLGIWRLLLNGGMYPKRGNSILPRHKSRTKKRRKNTAKKKRKPFKKKTGYNVGINQLYRGTKVILTLNN